MGQLNIKHEAVPAETRAVAAELGTSVTAAIGQVVREMRAEPARRRRGGKHAAIMAVAERAARLVPSGVTSDHADLYDEHGLPK